jgi:hypothetical protein
MKNKNRLRYPETWWARCASSWSRPAAARVRRGTAFQAIKNKGFGLERRERERRAEKAAKTIKAGAGVDDSDDAQRFAWKTIRFSSLLLSSFLSTRILILSYQTPPSPAVFTLAPTINASFKSNSTMLAQKNSILHRKPKELIVGPTASSIESDYAKEVARNEARAKRKADLREHLCKQFFATADEKKEVQYVLFLSGNLVPIVRISSTLTSCQSIFFIS